MERQMHSVETAPQAAVVSTYVPRNCGIATFSRDLVEAMRGETEGSCCQVVALDDRPQGYDYPREVGHRIQQHRVNDYRKAADFINFSAAQLVLLQHEFGIFGGEAGSHLTSLISRLKKPLVTTCHTLLRDPSPEYRRSMEGVILYSSRLVVLSRLGGEILQEVYGVAPGKIVHIHHGVPAFPREAAATHRSRFGVEDRFVILTFGLLSENKGIEVMLDALPPVVARHPEILYVILGVTHPEVRRREGERYRLGLERRVRDLGLGEHVVFHDRFVEQRELCGYLNACDLYVTTYHAKEQVVSGTLAYAVGMGKPVISTPYWYAEEMLADGRGRLVGFGDVAELSEALLEVVGDASVRAAMSDRSHHLRAEMAWPQVARRYLEFFREVVSESAVVAPVAPPPKPPRASLPEVKLDHLLVLSDDDGVIQHTCLGVPDRTHGYSADDVGRALVVLLRRWEGYPTRGRRRRRLLPRITTYLSFLRHAQTEDGHFHNFMAFDRRFLDERGSEDTLGRVVWGLGWAVRVAPTDPIRRLALQMLEEARPHLEALRAPRARAYALCGLVETIPHLEAHGLVRGLTDGLVALFEAEASDDWPWLEPIITYGNAKICEALLRAYRVVEEGLYLDIGLQGLEFLTRCQLTVSDTQAPEPKERYFDLIGNDGWYRRGGDKAPFGQQPIDAGYLVEAYVIAHQVTGEERYMRLAQTAFEWFLGRNRAGLPLYDFPTGACADGLDAQGVSLNQGAESTICFLLALLALGRRRTPDREPEPSHFAAPSIQ